VAALIVGNDKSLTAEDLLAHVRPQLARYKLPRQIEFVDALPRTASGKVQRNMVIETFSQFRSRL